MNPRVTTMQRDVSRLLIVLLLLAGCAKPQPPVPSREQLPRLDEVQSRLPPPPPQADIAVGSQTRLAVLRVDLLASQPLTEAWTIAEQRGVEPALGPVWRDNGLRCAVLHRSLYDAFIGALPTALARRLSLLASQAPTVIDFTPATTEPRIITLTLSGGGTTDVGLPPGSSRLLVTTEPAGDDAVLIALTPQHHWPKPSVKPRTRMEKQLDGRAFNLLRLQTRLRTDEVLIIGVPHPQAAGSLAPPEDEQPESPAHTETDNAESPTTQPSDEFEAPFTPVEPEPLRLGRLILEGIKHKKHVQMVWVIAIEGGAQ